MFGRSVTVAVLSLLTAVAWALPAPAQGASTQTPSTQVDSQAISHTLEALRTLLQNTETRLEQVETRLEAQDAHTSQLQSQVADLQERVDGQLSILSERVASQRAQTAQLQTIAILIAAGLVIIVGLGWIVLSRRLRALEALQDHVGGGVEQDEPEEPSQQ